MLFKSAPKVETIINMTEAPSKVREFDFTPVWLINSIAFSNILALLLPDKPSIKK